MLSLDGQQLLGENDYRELDDFINKYLPLESFMPWMMSAPPQGGLAMITQPIGIHPHRKARINRLVWPTGMSRFGYGHFLADSDAVGMIVADAYNNDGSYNQIQLKKGNPETNQTMDSNGNSVGTIVLGETISTMVYLLPPTPLSGIRGLSIMSGLTASLYLLTVVDSRYMFNYQNVGDIQIDSSTTWQSLIDMFFSTLGANIKYTVDTIDPDYLAPSIQMFTLPYEPIPIVLDAIARNIGMRWVANFDGSFAAQLYNTALNVINQDMMNNDGSMKNRNVIAGGQRFASPL